MNAVDILGFYTSVALADVGLCPSIEVVSFQRRFKDEIGVCLLFDADGLDLNETCSIRRLESTEFVHGGLLLVIEPL